MKSILPALLLLGACGAQTAPLLLVDGSYPASSAPALLFMQKINAASLFSPIDGSSISIGADGSLSLPDAAGRAGAYALESVADENRAYFQTPITLRNGIDSFPGFVGLIYSNQRLYLAQQRMVFRLDGDDATLHLHYDKKNITMARISTNSNGYTGVFSTNVAGTLQVIGQKP